VDLFKILVSILPIYITLIILYLLNNS